MALTPERIDAVALKCSNSYCVENGSRFNHDFARAIEAEVRKQDDALILQLVEALENSSDLLFKNPRKSDARDLAITAGRARLEGKP